MQKLTLGLVAVAVAGLAIGTAFSESPPDREGGRRAREGRPQRGEGRPPRGDKGGREGRPHGGPPLMMALDTDRDGEISAKEIENAAAALKSLDKNNDGKLTRDEIRPDFGHGRPGEAGRGRPGADGRPGRRGPGGGDFLQRIMHFDKNKDGKLTKDEVPEKLQHVLERADTNKDGALDKDEIKQLAKRMKDREGRGPEGRRPGEKGGRRPKGRRPGGEGGGRPERPRDE